MMYLCWCLWTFKQTVLSGDKLALNGITHPILSLLFLESMSSIFHTLINDLMNVSMSYIGLVVAYSYSCLLRDWSCLSVIEVPSFSI